MRGKSAIVAALIIAGISFPRRNADYANPVGGATAPSTKRLKAALAALANELPLGCGTVGPYQEESLLGDDMFAVGQMKHKFSLSHLGRDAIHKDSGFLAQFADCGLFERLPHAASLHRASPSSSAPRARL
nr:hypothetical protein [Mesorhizobium sp. BR1-1-2]